MANVILKLSAAKLWTGDLDMNAASSDHRILLVSSAFTPNDATNDFLNDVGAGILALSAALTNVVFTDGRLTSDPAQFAGGSITTGTAVNAYYVRYGPGGADNARELVLRFDTRADSNPLNWSVQAGVDATLTPNATTGWCSLANY